MADLNRRIRIEIEAEGAINEHGEYVPGPVVTNERLWCQRRDLGSNEDILDDSGGLVITSFVTFIVRYRGDLVSTRDSLVTVYETIPDGTERDYYIRRMSELEGERRRFLELECGSVG